MSKQFAINPKLDFAIERFVDAPTRLVWEALTKYFTPCPTRLGGKSWSDCPSDRPPSANWRHRSTCNSRRSCSTSRCSNGADW